MNTHYVRKGVHYIMRNSQLEKVIKNYIRNNYKEYILVGLLFLIGIFIGVMIINNCKEAQITEISTYISNFTAKFKGIENINTTDLIIKSIKNNIILAMIIWLAGTTVIGIPIVFISIIFRGIVLGYTISSFTITLGIGKWIAFCIISIFLQNLLFLPAILTLGVSSIKLYKSIIKDKRKENIKIGIIRHTIISILMVIILVLSSIIENTISLNILRKLIKYF